MPLQQLDADLWVADRPRRFFGLELGARMTVVRLPDARLWLHSPVAADPDLVAEVQALGRVAYLVAPNLLHHVFIGDWKRALPDAAVHVAPGLDAKRPDLEVAGVLGTAPDPGWEGTLDQLPLTGMPAANEVVFFHRPSATLIAADLAFNIDASSPLLTRLAIRLIGSPGQLAPTLVEKLLVRDRGAFRSSVQRLLAWPFDRVVVAHGKVCEKGGREALARSHAWLLGPSGESR